MIIAVNFQLKQLERRSLKKIRASTGFEPVTSAIPVRCSNPVEALIFSAMHWYPGGHGFKSR